MSSISRLIAATMLVLVARTVCVAVADSAPPHESSDKVVGGRHGGHPAAMFRKLGRGGDGIKVLTHQHDIAGGGLDAVSRDALDEARGTLRARTAAALSGGGSQYQRGDTNAVTDISVLSETVNGCRHSLPIILTHSATFPMCVGHSPEGLKHGMSIINLLDQRGYLPTCRAMQMMLLMHAKMLETVDKSGNFHDGEGRANLTIQQTTNNIRRRIDGLFVDVGANIGSCSVHMAALGLPVVAVEPVLEHVRTIQGSSALNPSFDIRVFHGGVATDARGMDVVFYQGGRNWGSTNFEEINSNTGGSEKGQSVPPSLPNEHLEVRPLDQIVFGSGPISRGPASTRPRVALVKIDCEGCEWAALLSGRRTLRAASMVKMELVQHQYTANVGKPVPTGANTRSKEYANKSSVVPAKQLLRYLHDDLGFDLFIDVFNEVHMYFGGNPEVSEVDALFGSWMIPGSTHRPRRIAAGQRNPKSGIDDIASFGSRTPLDSGAESAVAGYRGPNATLIDACIRKLLSSRISDVEGFNHKAFLDNKHSDIIGIKRDLSRRMQKHWGLV